MEAAFPDGSRRMVLRLESQQVIEVAKIAGGVLGGALGVKFFDRIGGWFSRRRKEPLEFTARIIDDGEEIRRDLMKENRELRDKNEAVLERAHKAEVELATVKQDLSRLGLRMERKDEQLKAVSSQVMQLGHVPVIFASPVPPPVEGGTI